MLLGVPEYMYIFVRINKIERVSEMQIVEIITLKYGLEFAINELLGLYVELAIHLNDG